MLVERCVEIHEVREESSCRYLAGKLVEVIVAVLREIADTSLLLPDLDREDGCRAVSYTFVCCVEDLADHAASFCRCVSTVVDGAEDNLVSATRVD